MLSETIRELRVQKGLSQQELADALGVSRSTLAHWENGRRPEEEHLEDIADFFGCEVEDLEYGVMR